MTGTKNLSKWHLSVFIGAFFALVVLGATTIQASLSADFTASSFSQFCSQNTDICNKVDFVNSRQGSLSCPDLSQVIDKIYVHAGSGQDLWELPDPKFSYSFANNGATVIVDALQGTHDISYIGVICTDPGVRPSPSPSANPNPSPSPSPGYSPSPSPSISPSPSGHPHPSVSPQPSPSCPPDYEICIICPGGGDCEVVIGSPSPKPTPTPSPSPGSSSTPSPSNNPSNGGGGTNEGGGGGVGGPSGEVLGTSTLAATGTDYSQIVNIASLVLGGIMSSAGLYGIKKNKK